MKDLAEYLLKIAEQLLEAGAHINEEERQVADKQDRNQRRRHLKPPRRDRQHRNLVQGEDNDVGNNDPDLNYDKNRRN